MPHRHPVLLLVQSVSTANDTDTAIIQESQLSTFVAKKCVRHCTPAAAETQTCGNNFTFEGATNQLQQQKQLCSNTTTSCFRNKYLQLVSYNLGAKVQNVRLQM